MLDTNPAVMRLVVCMNDVEIVVIAVLPRVLMSLQTDRVVVILHRRESFLSQQGLIGLDGGVCQSDDLIHWICRRFLHIQILRLLIIQLIASPVHSVLRAAHMEATLCTSSMTGTC
jgi:hypothetical protein